MQDTAGDANDGLDQGLPLGSGNGAYGAEYVGGPGFMPAVPRGDGSVAAGGPAGSAGEGRYTVSRRARARGSEARRPAARLFPAGGQHAASGERTVLGDGDASEDARPMVRRAQLRNPEPRQRCGRMKYALAAIALLLAACHRENAS